MDKKKQIEEYRNQQQQLNTMYAKLEGKIELLQEQADEEKKKDTKK